MLTSVFASVWWMMKTAMAEGDDPFVQWHLENCLNNDAKWLMPLAASFGRVNVLEQVWKRGVREEVVKEALLAAARKGPVDAVAWFHEHVEEGWSKTLMDMAAEYGNLDVVVWLHENRHEGCTANAMDHAARNGHLAVLQWLHENRHEGCTRLAMSWAATYDHLTVVQWLHENRHEGCTDEAMMEIRLQEDT